MSSGRAAKIKNKEGFTTRTVMAMVHEMATARESINRASALFAILAAEHGIKLQEAPDDAAHGVKCQEVPDDAAQ